MQGDIRNYENVVNDEETAIAKCYTTSKEE